MLNIDDKDKEFLAKNIKDFDKYVRNDDLNGILDQLNEMIVFYGHDKNYDITDYGRFMERIYDRLYMSNP